MLCIHETNQLVTDATSEPVTLEEAKAQCQVLHDAEDAQFNAWITAARKHIEQLTNRSMLTTVRRITLDAFPNCIKLWKPPIISVTSITYIDTAGATQTLSASTYTTSLISVPGRITPAYGLTWPSVQSRMDAVNVNYTAGYASAVLVPQPLKQAMLLLVRHWWENRDGKMANDVDFTVDALCSGYMVPEYG
jgi:uncharacterized phiE125 gp8 family phage protein